MEFVRLGRKNAVHQDIMPYYENLQNQTYKALEERLRSIDVIGVTIDSSAGGLLKTVAKEVTDWLIFIVYWYILGEIDQGISEPFLRAVCGKLLGLLFFLISWFIWFGNFFY